MIESQRKALSCLPVDIRQMIQRYITSLSRASRCTVVSVAISEADNPSTTLVGRIVKLAFEISLLVNMSTSTRG